MTIFEMIFFFIQFKAIITGIKIIMSIDSYVLYDGDNNKCLFGVLKTINSIYI